MQDFRKLKVWEKSHQLTLDVYRTTTKFPSDERFGLTSQLRRATASIAANIAEGSGRGGETEFARFLTIAIGSASEVEYFVILARDLAYMNETKYSELQNQVIEIKRMLASLVKKVKPTKTN